MQCLAHSLHTNYPIVLRANSARWARVGACSGILYLHTLRRSVCNFFSPAFVRAHLFLWPALSLQWVSQQKWLHNLSGLTHGDMLCYVCWQRVYRPFLSSCDLMDWSALPDARLPLLPSLCSSFLPCSLQSLIPCAQIPLLGLPNYYSVALIGDPRLLPFFIHKFIVFLTGWPSAVA